MPAPRSALASLKLALGQLRDAAQATEREDCNNAISDAKRYLDNAIEAIEDAANKLQ